MSSTLSEVACQCEMSNLGVVTTIRELVNWDLKINTI